MGIFIGLIISTSTNYFNVNQSATNHTIPLSSDNDLELDLIVNDNILHNDPNVLMNSTNIDTELETENTTKKSSKGISILNLTSQLLGNPRFLFFLFITLLIAIV